MLQKSENLGVAPMLSLQGRLHWRRISNTSFLVVSRNSSFPQHAWLSATSAWWAIFNPPLLEQLWRRRNTKGWQFQWRRLSVPVLSANINNPLTFLQPLYFTLCLLLSLVWFVAARLSAAFCFPAALPFPASTRSGESYWCCTSAPRKETFCQIHQKSLIFFFF